MKNGAASLKNNLVVPQKFKHRVIIWPNNSTPMYIPKNTHVQQNNVYMNVPSGIIHNSQKSGNYPNVYQLMDEFIK